MYDNVKMYLERKFFFQKFVTIYYNATKYQVSLVQQVQYWYFVNTKGWHKVCYCVTKNLHQQFIIMSPTIVSIGSATVNNGAELSSLEVTTVSWFHTCCFNVRTEACRMNLRPMLWLNKYSLNSSIIELNSKTNKER